MGNEHNDVSHLFLCLSSASASNLRLLGGVTERDLDLDLDLDREGDRDRDLDLEYLRRPSSLFFFARCLALKNS